MTFRIGITRDVLKADGTPFAPDIGLESLDAHPEVEWEVLPEPVTELRPEHTAAYDGLLLLSGAVPASAFGPDSRLSVIARFGVGYDGIDVEALTANGVALTITPDGVRRPVASGMLALLLALAHRIPERDALTRAGRWAEKGAYHGIGLAGRTIGIVGLGNIGVDFATLLEPFGAEIIAYDPYAGGADAAMVGATLLDLDEVMSNSDFVCVCCPLTPETAHMIDADQLALMKPSAYLINVGRGPLVDEPALIDALRRKVLAGAALDVFEQEPVDLDNPLLSMSNVIVTPHAVAHTDQLVSDSGKSACRALLAVADGRVPDHVVNRAVVDIPAFARRIRVTEEVG